MTKKFIIWIIIFLVLNLLDALMTINGVAKCPSYEGNPIMGYLLELGPWQYFFPIKMGLGLLFASLVCYLHKIINEEFILRVVQLAVILYFLVVSLHVYCLI